MALTRITSNVIKDATIQEGKFDKTYLDATNADIATQKITFQSDLEVKVGSTGATYFNASGNLVSITAPTSADPALTLVQGNLTLDAGNITLVGTGIVTTPFLRLGNGNEAAPGLYFGAGYAGTGFYHIDTDANAGAVDTVGISVGGTKQLTLTANEVTFNNRQIKILSQAATFDTVIRYDLNSSTLRFGGSTNLLEIYTGDDVVVNVRSVDGAGSAYPSDENRVGINTTSPAATLDVNGTIRATSYQNLTLDSLPTITPAKGGTGLTSIGQPEQLLRVNQAGTELEYFTDNPGDVSNLAGFGVAGDPNIYHVTARDALGGAGNALRLTTSNVATFSVHSADVPQFVKVFGINTTNIDQYDSATAGTTLYSNWALQISDPSASFCSAQGASNTAAINYTYYAALLNFKTGVVSSLKKLKHSAGNTQD